MYAWGSRDKQAMQLLRLLRRTDSFSERSFLEIGDARDGPTFASSAKCLDIAELALQQCQLPARTWASNLAPWESIVERARSLFGERWAFYHMANIAAGIESRSESSAEAPDLLNPATPLCQRSRFARLRTQNPGWWSSQFENARTRDDILFASLVCLTWAGLDVMEKQAESLNNLVSRMEEEDWYRLDSSLARALMMRRRSLPLDSKQLPSGLSPRMVAALCIRATRDCTTELCEQYLREYDGFDKVVLQRRLDWAVHSIIVDPSASNWRMNLPILASCHSRGEDILGYPLYRKHARDMSTFMPPDVARQILENSDSYPFVLVQAAELSYRQWIASQMPSVAQTAEQEKWFAAT
jgi:hypothetical protein